MIEITDIVQKNINDPVLHQNHNKIDIGFLEEDENDESNNVNSSTNLLDISSPSFGMSNKIMFNIFSKESSISNKDQNNEHEQDNEIETANSSEKLSIINNDDDMEKFDDTINNNENEERSEEVINNDENKEKSENVSKMEEDADELELTQTTEANSEKYIYNYNFFIVISFIFY